MPFTDYTKGQKDGVIASWVRAGDSFWLPGGGIVTVTQKAIDCDCGKGLLCPENIQEN